MARDPSEALNKWREAEAAYAAAVAPFTTEGDDARTLRKKDLLTLVELRGKADRSRDKYFRACQTDEGD